MGKVTKLCLSQREVLACGDGETILIRYTTTLAPDGTEIETATFHDPATGAPIAAPAVISKDCVEGAPLCYEAATWQPWVDNHSNPDRPVGAVVYPQFDHDIEVCWSDGSVTASSWTAPGAGQWGPLNDLIAATIQGMCPGQTWIGPSGDTGDNNPRGDDGDPSTPYGAYAHGVDVCPGEKIPVKATAVRKRAGRADVTIPMAVGVIETKETVWFCKSCGEAGEWQDGDGNPIEEPACVFPCGTVPDIPVKAEPACTVETIGPFCDIVQQEDEDGIPIDPTQDDIVQPDVFLAVITCDGNQTFDPYIIPGDPSEPESYEVQGYLGDCDSLEPFVVEPPCNDDCDFLPVSYQLHHAGQDNNGVPSIPVRFSESYDIEVTQANGNVTVISIPATAGWTQQIDAWVAAYTVALPNCTFSTRLRNPNTGQGGFNIPGPAADADLPSMFWRYMAQECCDPGELIVKAEIVACSDPTRVGGLFGVEATSSECIHGYVCLSCAGAQYYDSEMNPIDAGSIPKCVGNCVAEAAIDCAVIECEDPCINGSTYINGRPPAGNSWTWGPYSGSNLNEFEAALSAAGYNVIQIGEKHQICPPFGAFGEDPDALLTNAVGTGQVPVEPNIDPDFVADDPTCAVQTVGKNDDRRDGLLDSLLEKFCEPECQYLTLCDEAGDPWLVCIDPAGTQVITGLDGTEPSCELQSVICGNIPASYYGVDVTRHQIGGVWVDVPADWATLSEGDRIAYLEDAIGATPISGGIGGEVCYAGADNPTTVNGFCAGRFCALTGWVKRLTEVCTGPEGELTICEDLDFDVVVGEPSCSSVAGTVYPVSTYESGLLVSTVWLDGDNNVVLDLGVLTAGECADTTIEDLLQELIDCLCKCDEEEDELPPECATECDVGKAGLDVTSPSAGTVTHTGDWGGVANAPIPANGWVITAITVTDSAGTVHPLGVAAGSTATGLAAGQTQSVNITGHLISEEAGAPCTCIVTDRPISANVQVL